MADNQNPNKRLNYFTGQFLKQEDFTDEQSYHLDRGRRHQRLFHTPGIAEGLRVIAEEGDTRLEVTSGTALDKEGRLIILPESRALQWGTSIKNQKLILAIFYDEKLTDEAPADSRGETRYMRVYEKAGFSFLPEDKAFDGLNIPLALITIDDDSRIVGNADTVRRAAGTVGNMDDLTVADDATIGGDLEIKGNLRVTGNIQFDGTINGQGLASDQPAAPQPVAMPMGMLGGIWAAQPMSSAEIRQMNVWQMIKETGVGFELVQKAVVYINYSINVQPDGKGHQLNRDYLATRLVVDGNAYGQSGSYFQPFGSDDPNTNLVGNLVLPLDKGAHEVWLEWYKSGGNVPSWSSDPGRGEAQAEPSAGFLSGRSLVVMAFYADHFNSGLNVPAPTPAGVTTPATPAAPVSSGKTLYVTPTSAVANSLWVREEPTENSASTGRLYRGREALVIEAYDSAMSKMGVNGQWIAVELEDGKRGYSAAYYLKVSREEAAPDSGSSAASPPASAPTASTSSAPSTSPPPVQPAPSAPPAATVSSMETMLYVTPTSAVANSLWVREEPTENSASTGRLYRGREALVIEAYDSAMSKMGVNGQWIAVELEDGKRGYSAAYYLKVSREEAAPASASSASTTTAAAPQPEPETEPESSPQAATVQEPEPPAAPQPEPQPVGAEAASKPAASTEAPEPEAPAETTADESADEVFVEPTAPILLGQDDVPESDSAASAEPETASKDEGEKDEGEMVEAGSGAAIPENELQAPEVAETETAAEPESTEPEPEPEPAAELESTEPEPEAETEPAATSQPEPDPEPEPEPAPRVLFVTPQSWVTKGALIFPGLPVKGKKANAKARIGDMLTVLDPYDEAVGRVGQKGEYLWLRLDDGREGYSAAELYEIIEE